MGLMSKSNNAVFCDECKKLLFISEKNSLGATGAEAQSLGFVYKNACLFSDMHSSLFFCDHVCAKDFYKANIKPNPEMTKTIEEMKARVPEMVAGICEGLAKIQKAIKARK